MTEILLTGTLSLISINLSKAKEGAILPYCQTVMVNCIVFKVTTRMYC